MVFWDPRTASYSTAIYLIGEAKKEVLKMIDEGYAPPVKRPIKVIGAAAQGMIDAELFNMQSAKFVSEYDAFLAKRIAYVISGGDVRTNSTVEEEVILNLEREAFVDFWKQEKTVARVEHMLTDGQTASKLIKLKCQTRTGRTPHERCIYRIVRQDPGMPAAKGAFKDTRPEDLLTFIMKAALEKTNNIEPQQIDDVMIGCSFPEAEQGLNIGRLATQIAGFPNTVSGATVNRFCCVGAGSHRPGITAGHGRLVGDHHRRGGRIHDLRAHGRQPSPPSP
jgi:hypothetical protein